MRTLLDDCEFVLVEHEAYCSIMSTLNQHIEKEVDQDTDETIREAERRLVVWLINSFCDMLMLSLFNNIHRL